MSAVSDQYAVALFELGLETNQLEDLKKTYELFTQGLDESTMEFFLHPKISKQEKKILVNQFKLPSLFRDFLYVLIDNNRFENIKEIHEQLKQLLIQMKNQMVVKVYSKARLTEQKVAEIKSQFESKYNRNVIIETIVDDTIVGGLKYEFAGIVLDNTVNQHLSHIKAYLGK